MQIEAQKVVSFDYELMNAEGQKIDSSEGREPLTYLHGAGAIIPGLEQALDGKSTGDHFEVTVPPTDAYGERDDRLMQSVPLEQFGEEKVEPGMQFRSNTPSGAMVFTVVSVDDGSATLDGNHPLAGETLQFDITVKEVREATAEELEHGHAHGPGGHQH